MPDPGNVFVGWKNWENGTARFRNRSPAVFELGDYSEIVEAYFSPIVSLEAGADTEALGLVWTTGGDAPWVGQNRFSADGIDALASGAMPHSLAEGVSWLETQVTGPARLSFKHMNGNGPANGLVLKANGVVIDRPSTWDEGFSQSPDWLYFLPPGVHTMRWEHVVNEASYGLMSVLDEVEVVATADSDNDGLADEWETIYFGNLSRNGDGDIDSDGVSDFQEYLDLTHPGTSQSRRVSVTLNTVGQGNAQLSPARSVYNFGDKVTFTATPDPGWTFLRWETTPSGYTLGNPATVYLGTDMTVTARFVPLDDLNEALDNFDLSFVTPMPGWGKDESASFDAEDSALSPPGQPGADLTFSTTLSGPQVVSFWWWLERDEAPISKLKFALNGNSPLEIDAEGSWRRVFLQLPAGEHSLVWTHFRSFGESSGIPSVARVDRVMNGIDTDEDGLPDDWEMLHFENLNSHGEDDDDLDGVSNQNEWADGTDPEDPDSGHYLLTVTSEVPGGVHLTPSKLVYQSGDQVELTVTPAVLPSFVQWSGDATGAANPLTVTMDGNKVIAANFNPISRGVDDLSRVFQTDPGNPWQIDDSSFDIWAYHDRDGASSPTDLALNEESWVEATYAGPGTLSFAAFARFDTSAGGNLRWLLDGAEAGAYDGNSHSVKDASIFVPAGSHTVRWIYRQGNDTDAGAHAALDHFVWSEFVPLDEALDLPGSTWTHAGAPSATWRGLTDGSGELSHDGIDAAESVPIGPNESAVLETTIHPAAASVVSFWWKVSSEAEFDTLGFLVNGAELPSVPPISSEQDWRRVLTTVPAGSHTLRWTYRKDGSVSNGQDRGWVDRIAILPLLNPGLGEALDQPAKTWTTSAGSAWTGSNLDSNDGIDAASSGAVASGEASWVETEVVGPDTVSFWWKVSSEPGVGLLRFLVDGTPAVTPISGETGWTQVSHSIPEGAHTLRWEYRKYGSTSSGEDRGWLDQVSLTPPPPPPVDFGDWLDFYGLSGPDADPGANPSGDGIDNLTKYAFNIPADQAVGGTARNLVPGTGSAGLPSITLVGPPGGRRLRVEYLRRRGIAGLAYRVEFASRLAPSDWIQSIAAETVTALDDDWERVVVEDGETSASDRDRYARVRVDFDP